MLKKVLTIIVISNRNVEIREMTSNGFSPAPNDRPAPELFALLASALSADSPKSFGTISFKSSSERISESDSGGCWARQGLLEKKQTAHSKPIAVTRITQFLRYRPAGFFKLAYSIFDSYELSFRCGKKPLCKFHFSGGGVSRLRPISFANFSTCSANFC